MSNSTSSVKSILLLTLAGVVSAVLTIVAGSLHYYYAPESDSVAYVYKGLLFGLCIAAYFVIFERLRSIWSIAVFILACAAADVASLYAAIGMRPLSVDSQLDIGSPALFAAGFAGAFIILAAGLFLFGPRNIHWKCLAAAFLCALGGGVLGILGWKIGGLLSTASPLVSSVQESTLFVLWQAGVALMLGLVLRYERSRAAEMRPVRA